MAGRSSDEIRRALVADALSWRGTAYHHQGSVRGAGADCLGLVRGLYRSQIGPEPAQAPPYTRDWAEASGQEALRAACELYLREIEPDAASAGDVLLFRMKPNAVAKHLGVLVAPGLMVHARQGLCVLEQGVADFLSHYRRASIAGAFAFPGC